VDGEKNFEGMFIRFDRMYEGDRHTQSHTARHTHTPHDGIRRACIASRGKNCTLWTSVIVPHCKLDLVAVRSTQSLNLRRCRA